MERFIHNENIRQGQNHTTSPFGLGALVRRAKPSIASRVQRS